VQFLSCRHLVTVPRKEHFSNRRSRDNVARPTVQPAPLAEVTQQIPVRRIVRHAVVAQVRLDPLLLRVPTVPRAIVPAERSRTLPILTARHHEQVRQRPSQPILFRGGKFVSVVPTRDANCSLTVSRCPNEGTTRY
jgi:hypothetical protein